MQSTESKSQKRQSAGCAVARNGVRIDSNKILDVITL